MVCKTGWHFRAISNTRHKDITANFSVVSESIVENYDSNRIITDQCDCTTCVLK